MTTTTKKINAAFNKQQKPAVGELKAAVKANDIAAVRKLLKRGASPDEDAVLLYAAGHSDIKIVRALANAGANVNYQSLDNWSTPLIEALSLRFDDEKAIEIARLLIEKGANVKLTSRHGDDNVTALNYAVSKKAPGAKDLVRLLLEKGADPNRRGSFGDTVITRAMTYHGDDPDIIRLLLDHGAQVNAFTGYRESALIRAARAGVVKTTHLLLERGADIKARDGEGRTVLDIAKIYHNDEIVKLLEEHATKFKPKAPAQPHKPKP